MSDGFNDLPDSSPIETLDTDINEDMKLDTDIGVDEVSASELAEQQNGVDEATAEMNEGSDLDTDIGESIEDNHSQAVSEASAVEQIEQREWVTEIRDVNIGDLPDPSDIHGPEDFHKVSAEQMYKGIERLQEMKPLIESGEGANSDYWYNLDQQRGLDPGDGYQSTYDAFYGNERIHLTKDGEQYDITNGRHRIWVAKQMGVESLPAEVAERREH